jgi:regulatory protein
MTDNIPQQSGQVKTITKITPQVKRKGRINIYIDGEFWSGAQQSLAMQIAVGDQLDTESLKALEEKIASEEALGWAANYLSRWPQTESRFVAKAKARGYGEDVITRIVELCTEYSYLDDRALAEGLVERARLGGRSRRWLQGKMREKGYSQELIEEMSESYDEAEALQNAIKHLSEDVMMQRLLSRGFSYNACREAGVQPANMKQIDAELEEEAIYHLAEKAWRQYGEVSNKSVAWLIRRGVSPGDAWEALKRQSSR